MLTLVATGGDLLREHAGFGRARLGRPTEQSLTDVDAMALMTKAADALRCGVSRQAITCFVRDWGLPTYGPRGLVDAEELDRVYFPRIDAGLPQLRFRDAYGRRFTGLR
jgi:hypothetical protein